MERIASLENVRILRSSELCSIDGGERVQRVAIRGGSSGIQLLNADCVLIRIGVVPNSEPFKDQLELDESGYIRVDVTGLTQIDRVYAVGDVVNPASPTLNSAIGMGVTAVKRLHQILS